MFANRNMLYANKNNVTQDTRHIERKRLCQSILKDAF